MDERALHEEFELQSGMWEHYFFLAQAAARIEEQLHSHGERYTRRLITPLEAAQ